ncbi:hypothetical protein ABE10_10920, partial [Bacillus toyonensis]|nr:hypothetical protein [Bacillus toyonensis]
GRRIEDRHPRRPAPVRREAHELLLVLAFDVAGQRGDERLLGDLHAADHLHALLAFLLLLQELALSGDVAAVALGEHVLADRADRLSRDDPGTDRGLDRHLELLPRDELAQPLGHHRAVAVGLVTMHDRAEGVDLLTLEQDVDLDEVGLLGARGLVVERRVPLCLRLQLVEEVEDDLAQWNVVAQFHTLLGEVLHAQERPAARLAELHHRSHVILREEDRCLDHRLGDGADTAVRVLARVRDRDGLAGVGREHLVDHARRRRDEVEAELPRQALGDDLQVQKAEEAAAEAEPEGDRGLRLVLQGRVRELELVERLAKLRVVAAVDRIDAGEDHGLRVGIARQRLGRRLAGVRDGVADLRLAHVLHPGDEVADLAHAESLGRGGLWARHADLEQLVVGAGGHHLDPLARFQLAVDHPDIRDDAAIGVIDGVEDHRPRGRVRVSGRTGDLLHEAIEQVLDTGPRLAGHTQHVLRSPPDEVRKLLRILLRLRRGQIDLVQDRDDREVVLQRQIEVRQRLRLDSLRRVHEEDRALAGGERARHLVGEVDVPRSVDHVQGEGLALDLPGHPDRLALDGDAALALDVHPVEVLRPHVALCDHPGDLEHAVGKGRLAVVDVSDDAEVPDLRRRRRGRLKRSEGAW